MRSHSLRGAGPARMCSALRWEGVDFIEEMHTKGEPLEQALVDAGIARLRPVMITVAATVLALFPLALHGGPLWQPPCYAQIGGLMGKGDLTLSRDACDLLRRHPWPGNIRELQNAIERSLITSEGALITSAHLAIPSDSQPVASPPQAASPAPSAPPPPASASGSLEDLERAAILEALQRAHGHKSRAAALLGLTRFQLYTRLKRLHIDVTPD